MPAQRIQLQHPDGTPWRVVGEIELRTLQDKGHVTRISARRDAIRVYRMKLLAQASTSHATASTITVSDARALAGLQRVDEVWIERLIGFGLVAETIVIPGCGYLDCVGKRGKCQHWEEQAAA